MLYLLALAFVGLASAEYKDGYRYPTYGYGAGLERVIGDDGVHYVQTPHGLRPAKCVVRHDSYDVHLEYNETGTIATYRDRRNYQTWWPRFDECTENAKKLFPGDGKPMAWDIDSGYTPPGNMGNFTSTYKLPNQTPRGSGLTYWFIGYQNNDGSGLGLTIAQPVVNSQGGWQTEPWNCCPSSQSNTGRAIQLSQGVATKNWMYASSSQTQIGSSYGGTPTTLTVATAGRNWDWNCVTLETYAGSDCSSYPTQPFDFGNMKLVTASGQSLTPSWSQPGRGVCNGFAKVNGPSDITITGAQ